MVHYKIIHSETETDDSSLNITVGLNKGKQVNRVQAKRIAVSGFCFNRLEIANLDYCWVKLLGEMVSIDG